MGIRGAGSRLTTVLLQRQHVADFAKRIEKEVTVAQFGPGHPVFCLSSLNCQSSSGSG